MKNQVLDIKWLRQFGRIGPLFQKMIGVISLWFFGDFISLSLGFGPPKYGISGFWHWWDLSFIALIVWIWGYFLKDLGILTFLKCCRIFLIQTSQILDCISTRKWIKIYWICHLWSSKKDDLFHKAPLRYFRVFNHEMARGESFFSGISGLIILTFDFWDLVAKIMRFQDFDFHGIWDLQLQLLGFRDFFLGSQD